MTFASAWLLNLALDSALLLTIAALIDRALANRTGWRELLWRAALFGGLLTATLQMSVDRPSLVANWTLASPAPTFSESSLAPTTSIAKAVTQTPTLAPPSSFEVRENESRDWSSLLSEWNRLIFAVWIAVALALLTAVAIRWRRLRNRFVDVTPIVDDALSADVRQIAAIARIATPRIFVMDSLSSPVAFRDRIVLPTWALAKLDRTHLRAMLAHEVAHIARRDQEWKLAIALMRAMLWFLPTGFARRRLDDLAELACDAFAARCLGESRDLAECLLVCAEHYSNSKVFELAPAMAARRSSLVNRIDKLLEGNIMENIASGFGARAVVLSSLVTFALAMPGVSVGSNTQSAPTESAPNANKGHSSIVIHDKDNDDSTIVSMSDDKHRFVATIRGKVTLNDEESDIASMTEGSTARLEETVDGSKEHIDLVERDGKLERKYFVGETEHPYDDRARAFMARATLDLARSGMDAQGRAKRLLAKGGAKRLLDEAVKVQSSYVSGIYIRALADAEKMTPNDLDRSIALIGNFDSDYERRQTLSHLLSTQTLDASRQLMWLQQVGRMQSDYDRAESLVAIAPKLQNSHDVIDAWLSDARGLRSPHDLGRTYAAFLDTHGVDEAQLRSVIQASESVNSDYDRGQLLKLVAQRTVSGESIAKDYAKSAQGLSSDHSRREALEALMHTDHFGAQAASAVLDETAAIHSAYDRSQVLVSLARVMPMNANLVARYREVAASLPSYERGAAEGALVQ